MGSYLNCLCDWVVELYMEILSFRHEVYCEKRLQNACSVSTTILNKKPKIFCRTLFYIFYVCLIKNESLLFKFFKKRLLCEKVVRWHEVCGECSKLDTTWRLPMARRTGDKKKRERKDKVERNKRSITIWQRGDLFSQGKTNRVCATNCLKRTKGKVERADRKKKQPCLC